MNILFLSYWEADDGLSRATVMPHLKILNDMPGVRKIVYCSIERSGKKSKEMRLGGKIVHVPIYSGKKYYHKLLDFLIFPRKLGRMVRVYAIDMLICRGALAGSLGHIVNRNFGTPYIVESFEPHADYMTKTGVWREGGLKYLFQRRWEKAQLLSAKKIITVSDNYRKLLVDAGLRVEKVLTVPCAVDLVQFSFNAVARREIRRCLGFFNSSIVGIYTGKFGGLYYDEEAFQIFSVAFKNIEAFKLIILTPDDSRVVTDKLTKAGIPERDCYVGHVSHDRVPSYLAAADFAFALYKSSPFARFLSPIKLGEYWANGLPVMLTKGIGDECDIIESEGGGATFSFEENGSVVHALTFINDLINRSNRQRSCETISKLAFKYRNFDRVRDAYHRILRGG